MVLAMKNTSAPAQAQEMLIELAQAAEASGNTFAGEQLRKMAETPDRFLAALGGEFLASSLNQKQVM